MVLLKENTFVLNRLYSLPGIAMLAANISLDIFIYIMSFYQVLSVRGLSLSPSEKMTFFNVFILFSLTTITEIMFWGEALRAWLIVLFLRRGSFTFIMAFSWGLFDIFFRTLILKLKTNF